MAEKPVCVEMNGDTKVGNQGSTTGPKQHKPSSVAPESVDDQGTTKTLTEINQQDSTGVSELDDSTSEVLRIQNGRLICENTANIASVNDTGLQLEIPESESQLLDFSNQNADATVRITIDPAFLESQNTTILPVIHAEQSEEQTVVSTVVCENRTVAEVSGSSNPEVTGTAATDGTASVTTVGSVGSRIVNTNDTVVLETSNNVPFKIVSSCNDKTEIGEGEAVNVINIPETGENVSAGFALVNDLITTEDLVTMTSDPDAINTDGPTTIIPVAVSVSEGPQSQQIITQVEATKDDPASSIMIVNTTAANTPTTSLETSVTSANNPQSESQLKLTDETVTEIDLGTACSASGALQLNVAESLHGNTNASGHQIVYMVTSRDKVTGLMQRFRVTVDPESVTHLPIGAINLGSALPGLAIGAGGQILAGDQVVTDVGGAVMTSGESTSGVGTVIHSTSSVGTSDGVSLSVDSGSSEISVAPAGLNVAAPVPVTKDKTQTEVFPCPEEGCNAAFTQRIKLKLHQLTHANDRPFKCEHEGCEWAFQTLYKLRRHEAGHTGLKPYMCDNEGCGKTFSTIYNLNIHTKLHKQQEYVVCEVEGCAEMFPSKIKLEIHQRKHFEDKQIKCYFPGCGKSFTTSSAFGSHQRIHQRAEQMYSCSVEGCDKIYDKACRLKLHMRSHTGERPFKCTFEGCKWAFVCQQKLSRHMVRHTGDRKYQCHFEGCNKLFTRLEHLKGHQVSHSGEKPYACNEPDCNARFSSRSSLYMHVKRHKQGKPMREKILFSCPFDTCTKSYNTKQGLKNHMVKEHGIQLPSAEDMVYIPTEPIQMALEQLTDISGMAGTTGAKTVVHIKSSVGVGPAGDASSSEPILQQAAESAEKSMEASTNLAAAADLLTPSATHLVTQGGLINDVPPGFAPVIAPALLAQDNVSPQTSLAGTCKIHQENHSGSARTDFMYKVGGIKKPPSLDNDSDQSNDGVMICTSYTSPTFTNTTSASLMLRDPTTGARFVQSQLLQDDPPDENDMVFSLTPPPSSSDQNSLGSDMPVNAILQGSEPPTEQCNQSNPADFLQTESTASEIEGFRESTINLQDLE